MSHSYECLFMHSFSKDYKHTTMSADSFYWYASVLIFIPWGLLIVAPRWQYTEPVAFGSAIVLLCAAAIFTFKYLTGPTGGGSFLFFSPIFNVADAAITTGVLSILLFQRRFFRDGFVEEQNTSAPIGDENAVDEDFLPEDNMEPSGEDTTAEASEPEPNGQRHDNAGDNTAAEQPTESKQSGD